MENFDQALSLQLDLSSYFNVILVEPKESLNIGSVARAMSNMGFANLHLVSPRDFSAEKALKTACHGDSLVRNIKTHRSIGDSIQNMNSVVGFSSQAGKHRPEHITLSEWLNYLSDKPATNTALLFGPEDTGLTMEHLARCRWIVKIPANIENPSLNLAQAVLIVVYELRKLFPNMSQKVAKDLATIEQYHQLDLLINNVLEACDFYRDGTPKPIPDLIKNLFLRIEADKREMGILMAVFSRIGSTISRLKDPD